VRCSILRLLDRTLAHLVKQLRLRTAIGRR
jgi:hypothetical protein